MILEVQQVLVELIKILVRKVKLNQNDILKNILNLVKLKLLGIIMTKKKISELEIVIYSLMLSYILTILFTFIISKELLFSIIAPILISVFPVYICYFYPLYIIIPIFLLILFYLVAKINYSHNKYKILFLVLLFLLWEGLGFHFFRQIALL